MKKIYSFILITVFSSTVFGQTIPSYVPTNGLVGWWPFNGNANDVSGNGFNGTGSNVTPVIDRFGNPNSAYNFNGNNSKIDILNFTQNPLSFCINLWFNASVNGTAGTNELLHRCEPSNRLNYCWNLSWGIQGNQNYLHSILKTNLITSVTQSGINLPINIWHMATMTFDGITRKIYINGILTTTTNLSGQSVDYTNKTGIYLGYDSQMDYFNGKIDDVGIWNRALTACEINQLYTSSISTISIQSSSNTICAGQTATLNVTGANTYTWSTTQNTASITLTPSISTNYSVIGTTSAGCTPTAAINISVNPLPTISVNNGTICNSQNFTLTPNGANTYTITGGNTVVSPTITTSYSVTGTSTAGCLSASAAVANVIVNPSPILSITGNTVLCTGETSTIFVSGANTYAWSNSATGNSITINNTPNTYNYTVTGTGTNSCTASTTVQVIINACTSIAQNHYKNLEIYPNPASNILNIGANDQVIGKTLKIFDAQSKLIQEIVLKTNNVLIISNWANGIYTVAIPEQNLTYKFVKE